MDRFLGGKYRQEEETSNPSKKHSHRKQTCDDQLILPSHQSLLPSSQNDGPGLKKLEKRNFGAPPRLKSVPYSKFHHKARNSNLNKILGAICGNNPSREEKSRSAKRSRRNNSSVSSGSSLNSPSQQAEHRSYHRITKRRKRNEENLQKRFDKDEEYRRKEKGQIGEDDNLRGYLKDKKEGHRRGDNFCGKIDNQPRNVSKRLTFSSSESDQERSPFPLHKDYLSPGFGGRVLDIIAENEVVGESSQTVMIADNKQASKNLVEFKTCKTLLNEQDLLAEYTNLAAGITDELTMERQKHFDEKSYLETVTQNLLSVFLERSSKNTDINERKSDSNQDTGASIFGDLNFVTPITSRTEAVSSSEPSLDLGSRKSREQKSLEGPPPQESAAFGIFSKDGHISAPKKNILPQFKPNLPERQLPERAEEPTPHLPLSFQLHSAFWSPSTTGDYIAGKSNNDLTFMKDAPLRNIDKEGKCQRKDTSKPADCGPNLKSYDEDRLRPTKRPCSEYLFSCQPIFLPNDDILELLSRREEDPESFGKRDGNARETERNSRRRTCTATSTTPIDYGISESPPHPKVQSIQEFRTTFLDESVYPSMRQEDVFSALQGFHRQRDHTGDGSLLVNPCGSTGIRCIGPTDCAESSKKEFFLNSVGLLSNNKDVVPNKEEWVITPKFYRRRMF